jgi:hypothetical protein
MFICQITIPFVGMGRHGDHAPRGFFSKIAEGVTWQKREKLLGYFADDC